MQKGIFEVQTLSPLFLSGADLNTAELRPPAFRGLLRYWQRALIGGMVGTDELGLASVQHAENALFGTINQASTVAITITQASALPRLFHEQISPQRHSTGTGYLFWSMAQSGREEKHTFKPARYYFPANTTFQVTLATRSGHEKQLQQVGAAFWLLTHLGGLGSRSRRCAGSLIARPLNAMLPSLPFTTAAHILDLKLQLEQGIDAARALNKGELRPPHSANFDILAHDTCRIWILQDQQPWSDAETALETIGTKLQRYRTSLPIAQRQIFGLPLPPLSHKRRSSPLLLRITALSDNRYVGIALLFKTIGNGVREADYALIEQWIHSFSAPMEVML